LIVDSLLIGDFRLLLESTNKSTINNPQSTTNQHSQIGESTIAHPRVMTATAAGSLAA
jgi:hypothetical protein